MNELQFHQIICEILQSGLGPDFRCRVSLPWADAQWNPFSKHCVLIHEGQDLKPCCRVYYDPEDDTLTMETIEYDQRDEVRFMVPLADPKSFERIEARIRCED